MSVIATAVRHLMAAGVTGDALLEAIAELEAQVRAEPKPRSSGAIRQERYRKNKASQPSQSITTVTSDAPLSLPPNENISNPPTHTPGNNTRTRKAPVLAAKPAEVSERVWIDFQTLRKRKGAPLTETALAGIADEARKAGWPLEAALAKCQVRGWQGFEADWLKGERPPSETLASDDPLTRRLMARKAAKETNVC